MCQLLLNNLCSIFPHTTFAPEKEIKALNFMDRIDTRTKSLTKAELRLMNILWDKGKATVQELHDVLEEPKPAYTTTLTVMQVLTRKGIVGFEKVGKANVYHPIMSREDYIKGFMEETRNTLFKGSLKSFMLFFAKHEKISKEEMEEILNIMSKD